MTAEQNKVLVRRLAEEAVNPGNLDVLAEVARASSPRRHAAGPGRSAIPSRNFTMEIVALAADGAKLAGVRGRGQRGKDAPARPQHVSAARPRGRDTELPFGPGLRGCAACSYRRAGSAVLAASTTRVLPVPGDAG